MPESSLSKIINISKIIRLMILVIAIVHIGSFLVTVLGVEENKLSHQIKVTQGESLYTAVVKMESSGENFALKLIDEGFNALAILGSVDILIYALIYFFIYQLFSLYQQGKIFTLANINCIKNIGRCLLYWVLLSLFYPVLVVLIIRVGGLSETLPLMFSIGSNDFIHLLSGSVI